MTAGASYVRQNTEYRFKAKDPVSAYTHFAGFVLAIIGMPVLLIRAAQENCAFPSMVCFAVFMLTMTLLYGASAAYHSFYCCAERSNRILKKIDHISIFYLIAGSYTPVCVCVLRERAGLALLITVWTIALLGTLFKALWVYSPKWVSSLIYISMGWAALSVLPKLVVLLHGAAFCWLLAGGVLYTAGGVIYALRLKIFRNAWFGNHELFHCLVLAGSLCHYILMYFFITPAG